MLNCNSRRCVSDPLARFARVSPSRGGDYRLQRESFILPLPEGESRRRRQGVAHTPSRIGVEQHGLQPWLHSSAATRLLRRSQLNLFT
jgi:hypothetical protein